MKAAAENYKGIQYVRISTLPQNQKNEILKSLGERFIIKILKNDSLLKDCVQYQHYEFWFENVFSKIRAEVKQPVHENVPSLIFSSGMEQILSTK